MTGKSLADGAIVECNISSQYNREKVSGHMAKHGVERWNFINTMGRSGE